MKLTINMLILFFLTISGSPQTTQIKFATLAPEGSTWMKVMEDYDKAVSERTNGAVGFKIYAGGVQGDEKDVLRKIRFNQLHSAGFTGVGLGEILPEVRVLDTPFLFKNKAEVDYIIDKFQKRFAEKFKEKGYVLLGWAEVGFVYIYSNVPARSIEDFQGLKMWMWEGDPLAEAIFKAFKINPVPLSVTDVLTSLQTGLIDAVYASPLACVGLQWFTKTSYVLNEPMTNSIGAVLLSKRIFERLTPEQQEIVVEEGRKHFTRLTEQTRKDNRKSYQEMLNSGMKEIKIDTPEKVDNFRRIGAEARRDLAGELYPAELMNQIESALAEFRNKSKENESD